MHTAKIPRSSLMRKQIAIDVTAHAAKRCGRVLAHARRDRGISGDALAAQAGVSRRTLSKVEQGDAGVAIGTYLNAAASLDVSWLFEVVSGEPVPGVTPRFYLSGASALALPPTSDAHPALWYSNSLRNPKGWQVAGMNLVGASALLGTSGLWDATEPLRALGLPVEKVWCAHYERAVFDLLYHFCEVRSAPVPNVQVSDIDDVVDIEKVSEWVTGAAPFLSSSGITRMTQWLDA